MNINKDDIWKQVKEIFKVEIDEIDYNTWISRLKPLYYNKDDFILYAPNGFTKKIIEQKYKGKIQEFIGYILGNFPNIHIVDPSDDDIDSLIEEDYVKEENNPRTKGQIPEENLVKEDSKLIQTEETDNKVNKSQNKSDILSDSLPTRNYTFDNFVVGKSNEFAFSAAMAVAKAPASTYNPLFIYGQAGLGKTHLLYACARKVLESFPDKEVVYLSSETFTNELIISLSEQKNEEFRRKYRRVDVLIIDDIQFIAGKTATQEEFFHTFNDLYNNSKQIIISSDRPPKEIETLEERLVSRFEWGLLADIQKPDFETRVAILNNKLDMEMEYISQDVIEYIAMNVKDNIRELEGALLKLLAYKKIMGIEDVDLDSCKQILENIISENENIKITVELIQEKVCEFYSISLGELKSKSRSKSIAFPRQIAMYLSRQLTDLSLIKIAESFNRDHSTIIHGIDKISELRDEDENLNIELNKLEEQIKAG